MVLVVVAFIATIVTMVPAHVSAQSGRNTISFFSSIISDLQSQVKELFSQFEELIISNDIEKHFSASLVPVMGKATVYSDSISSQWIDASWSIDANFLNTVPVQGGSRSITVNAQAWGALSFHSGNWGGTESLDPTQYSALHFSANGGSNGVTLHISLQNDSKQGFKTVIKTIPAGAWSTIEIPLRELNSSGYLFDRVNFMSANAAIWYADEIYFKAVDTAMGIATTASSIETAPTNASEIVVYDNEIKSPWYNGSYTGTFSLASTEQSYSSPNALKAVTNAYGTVGFQTWQTTYNLTPYKYLELAVYSNDSFDLRISLQNRLKIYRSAAVVKIAANQWSIVAIPLSTFNLPVDFSVGRIYITSDRSPHTWFIDDVRFLSSEPTRTIAAPAPSSGETSVSTQTQPQTTSLAPSTAGFDFSVSVGNRSVVGGGSGTNSVVVSRKNGTPPQTILSLSNLPEGVTGTFSKSACTPTCSSFLLLKTSSNTPAGPHKITVNASTEALVRTGTFTLTVVAPAQPPNTDQDPIDTKPKIEPEPDPVVDTSSMWVYKGGIASPWRNVSWGSSISFLNMPIDYGNTVAVRVSSNAWGALSFHRGAWFSGNHVDPSIYKTLELWVNGGTTGFVLHTSFEADDGKSSGVSNAKRTIPAGKWTHLSIPVIEFNPLGYPMDRVVFQVDRAVTWHAYDIRFISGSSSGGGGSVSDTTAPTVSISAPTPNSTVSGSVTVLANASDNVGVTKVEFYRGTILIGTDTSSPYSTSWNTTSFTNGSYAISAKAYDAALNTKQSISVIVVVSNIIPPTTDTMPPNVSIASPLINASLSGSITLTASASDNIGVAGVQFKLDGTNIGTEDTTAPYSTAWNTATATNGSHVLTAVARDATGNTRTSTAVGVMVSNTIVITPPSGNFWVTAYLNSWDLRVPGTAENDGDYTPVEIDWSAFTHLIFFATNVYGDGTCCRVGDINTNYNAVRINAIVSAAHTHGKPILFSVGGAGASGFSTAIANASTRTALVNSLFNHLVTYKYDGIDLDPEEGTLNTTNLVAFSSEMRAKLNTINAFYDASKKPLLTAAIYNSRTAWAAASASFDQINLMSYDMMGNELGETWHNNAAKNVRNSNGSCATIDYSEKNGGCLYTIEDKFLAAKNAGIPVSKIGGGISFNGYIQQGGVNLAGTNAPINPRDRWSQQPTMRYLQEWNGLIVTKLNETVYYALKKYLFPTFNQENFKWDETSKVPYISVDREGVADDLYISYTNAESVRNAVQTIKSLGMGGMILWEIGGGYLGTKNFPPAQYPGLVRDELLQAVKNSVWP